MGFDGEKYSKMITGSSSYDGMSHYEIDSLVDEKWGDKVCTDSEHSQLFIFTTPEVADQVREFVSKLGKEGEMCYTYGGDSYESKFSVYDTED